MKLMQQQKSSKRGMVPCCGPQITARELNHSGSTTHTNEVTCRTLVVFHCPLMLMHPPLALQRVGLRLFKPSHPFVPNVSAPQEAYLLQDLPLCTLALCYTHYTATSSWFATLLRAQASSPPCSSRARFGLCNSQPSNTCTPSAKHNRADVPSSWSKVNTCELS